MFQRVSYSTLFLAFSVFPAFAGDGGDDSAVTGFIFQALGRFGAKLVSMLTGNF